MRTERVSIRQFAWMTIIMLVGSSMFTLPRHLPRIASHDAWISYFLPALYAFGVAALYAMLAARYPGKNIFEITREAVGRWVGGVLNGIIIIHILLIMIRDLKLITFFIQTTLLSDTPVEMILLLLISVMVYYAGLSIEDCSRIAELIFPLMVGFTICIPLLVTGDLALHRIEPFLILRPSELGLASLIQAAWFGDILIMGAFLHTLTHASSIRAALNKGTMISTMLLTVILLNIIIVLGDELAANSIYPGFTLIEQMQLTDFLDRLEIFILCIWIPFATMKSVLSFIAILYGLASFFHHRDTRPFRFPAGLLLLFISIFSFNSIVDVFNYSMFPTVINQAVVQFLLFGCLFLSMLFKRGLRHKPNGHHPPRSRKTIGLLWATTALVLAAIFFTRTHIWIGYASALGYCLLLVLAFLSSIQEANRMKKIE